MTALRPHLLGAVLLTLGTLAYFVHAVAQDAPVRVFLEGARTQFEPGHLRLRIRVTPHPDNRGLTVAAISDGYGRSSYEQLEGDRSPRTRWIDWPNIPEGEYDVIAAVARGNGVTAEDRTTVSVLGRGF